MESRFSTEDIFIWDDLILMKASVTHEANLCNLLYILWLEGKIAGEQAYNVQVRPSIEKKENTHEHTHTHTHTHVKNMNL